MNALPSLTILYSPISIPECLWLKSLSLKTNPISAT